MSYKTELNKDILDSLFSYCPLSGSVKKLKDGTEVALSTDPSPKISFRYNNKVYKIQLHLIVWCMIYGKFPNSDEVIFHRDFNQKNMCLNNLLLITPKDNYGLLTAYKNLTLYCDIKLHSQDKHVYLVRYLANKRLKYERYDDYGAAQKASNRLKSIYRRHIIKFGGIPPL